jgi:spermidine/putrescine transport system permease protein
MTTMPAPTPSLIIWNGQLTGRARLQAAGWLFIGLGVAWLLVFLVLPSFFLFGLGFAQRGNNGEIVWQFTTDNYVNLAKKDLLFDDTFIYLNTFLRTVLLSAVTTLVCIAVAYPLAFFIASRSPRSRYLWLTLVMVPACINIVVRTYAWKLILDHRLPLSQLAQGVGLLQAGQGLDPSPLAIYIGMITAMLPFAVLPIYASVERLDWSIVDAAWDLYASRVRVIRTAILPQTTPGLWVAAVLTFVPAMGMFVVPDMLGGAKFDLIGNQIQRQFGAARNIPFGAALSISLVILTLIGLWLVRRRRAGTELM